MLDFTVRALAWVLSICMPNPRGRHRAEGPSVSHPISGVTPTLLTDLIDGSASPLVRPYLLTPDERHLQRERRRALYLATLGIDTGQDHIPGIPGIPGIPAIPAIRVGAAR
ncbi:hypothetical protein JIX56_15480 [Streptomyces sp. CA-210063]|uniref:hypothetical protein n=1 Tax=Streptomyces sp. CA-210063 TaxID=2801029 RepID=UPI00214AF65D|nr:hypothetical protein [Streptomyces sp. CA-210063]UUU31190.1 hypothetical protein JIX56_15480 [Streptomyces sp. CA-210063]